MTLPSLHPDMKVLIDARGPKILGASVAEQRRQWNEYAAKLARPHPPELNVWDMKIPTREREVPVRVYRHREAAASWPAIIYMHGGGFMLGDLDSSDSIAWGYTYETGATVISVDYRLTPEHVWPAAFDDCYGVLLWLAENGRELGIDPSRVALAGDSAGGRLTAGLSLKARDEGPVRIAAQAIIYGSAGAVPNARSFTDFAEGYGLTAERYKGFYAALFPDDRYDQDPYAWPIRAEDVSNLPPALVHTAELDPVRDHGRAYAAKLALAGSPVTYRDAKGMMHGFMRARFTGSAAKAEFDFICAFLKSYLFGS
ncbi:alpha/beta hydrolase [Rhodoligotrophos ferricapiens]|uniref:alpha/beta hydrolase n=1 Tax=Rhodoligotrophos ferricapiens TaxID=3069264 RepID=UPI00315C5447